MRRASGKERTGVKRKSPSAINMARPVDRQHDRLSRAGDALGAKLFSLAGLVPAHLNTNQIQERVLRDMRSFATPT